MSYYLSGIKGNSSRLKLKCQVLVIEKKKRKFIAEIEDKEDLLMIHTEF